MSVILWGVVGLAGFWLYCVGAAVTLRIVRINKPDADMNSDGYVAIWPIVAALSLMYFVIVKPISWLCKPILGKTPAFLEENEKKKEEEYRRLARDNWEYNQRRRGDRAFRYK